MIHDPSKSWFDNALEQLQIGESLIADSVDGLYRGWKVSAEALGKLCTGTDRWHALLHEIQRSVSLADILRARMSS